MKNVYIKRNDLFKNIQMILCNNITQADESFLEDNTEIFFYDCETCNGTGYTDEDEQEHCQECEDGRCTSDPFQYFLAGMSEWDKEYLEEWGVTVGYSNLLDTYVIPIYDYGTSWSMFSYSKEVEDDYTPLGNETTERTTCY
jgi:hypothetical protein